MPDPVGIGRRRDAAWARSAAVHRKLDLVDDGESEPLVQRDVVAVRALQVGGDAVDLGETVLNSALPMPRP